MMKLRESLPPGRSYEQIRNHYEVERAIADLQQRERDLVQALVRVARGQGTGGDASLPRALAADRPALSLRVITPTFLEDRPEGPKVMSFWAKQARGAMARFIVQNRLRDPAALVEFGTGGYRYRPDMSTPDRPVFLRDTN